MQISKAKIFQVAWILARREATAQSVSPRSVFGAALRQSWAASKEFVARQAAQAKRVADEAPKAAAAIARKTIVKLLDKAADRTANGATSAQTWFLAGLMAEAGEDGSAYAAGSLLSKPFASRLIDQYRAKA